MKSKMEMTVAEGILDDAPEDAQVHCAECQRVLEPHDYVYYFEDQAEIYFCETCAASELESTESEAEEFALQNCKLTAEIPEFDHLAEQYKPTREEYDAGNRDANTPNAFLAWARHNRTNYDKLIRDLSRGGLEDGIFYVAIRNRVDSMILEEYRRRHDQDLDVEA